MVESIEQKFAIGKFMRQLPLFFYGPLGVRLVAFYFLKNGILWLSSSHCCRVCFYGLDRRYCCWAASKGASQGKYPPWLGACVYAQPTNTVLINVTCIQSYLHVTHINGLHDREFFLLLERDSFSNCSSTWANWQFLDVNHAVVLILGGHVTWEPLDGKTSFQAHIVEQHKGYRMVFES